MPVVWLRSGEEAGKGDVVANSLSAAQERLHDPAFLQRFSMPTLSSHLPLLWPTPPDTPPSPKRRYRSHYRYPGFQDLWEPGTWSSLSFFDIVLRLVDFSPMEAVLAQKLYAPSARGKTPFHPVSLFLLNAWQRVNNWSRTQTIANLQNSHYKDYAARFGFQMGTYPTEGGLRYFETVLGNKEPEDLLTQSMNLVKDFLSQEALKQGLVGVDGMIHDAASRQRCTTVRESCYQPAPRPCPAKEEKGRQGCDCVTPACATRCQHAPSRDCVARYVWYSGSNQTDSPNTSGPSNAQNPKGDRLHGEGHYGYRSVSFQICDPRWRTHWVLSSDFLPANAPEEPTATRRLAQLPYEYPWLPINVVAADSAMGHEPFLSQVYDMGAKRVIDLRAHDSDRDVSQWPLRGYDKKGRPLCPFGYGLLGNGHDSQRKRHKWACFHACTRDTEPRAKLDEGTYPPIDCPHLERHHGLVMNVARNFEDGSTRLVRDLPVGSPQWEYLYHQGRNASESRNSSMEAWGLKRLSVFGQPRSRANIVLADLWRNLLTLARLVKEANTVVQARDSPRPCKGLAPENLP